MEARLGKRGNCLRAVLTDEATRQDLRCQHSQRRLFNAASLRRKHHLLITAPGGPLHILWVGRHSACPLRGAWRVRAPPGTSSAAGARCRGPPALAGETCAGTPGVSPAGRGRQTGVRVLLAKALAPAPPRGRGVPPEHHEPGFPRRSPVTRSSPGPQSCSPLESKMNTARQQFSFLTRSLLITVLKKLTFKTRFHKQDTRH